MTKFQADPDTISAAAKSFHAEVKTISDAETKAVAVNMTSSAAGSYGDWATGYANTYKQMVETLLKAMKTKTDWAGDNLHGTAEDYSKRDSGNAAGLKNAGKGA